MHLLVALLLVAAPQDKAYDLKLNTPRKPGQKHALKEFSVMKMQMKVMGQVAGENEEKKNFEAVEEVVGADGAGTNELRWAFTKAERLEEGMMKPFGFQGKTVVVKSAKGKDTEFKYADGGALAEDDLAGIKDAFDEDAGTDKDPAKVMQPKQPVKVGESWSPDVAEMAKMFDEEMAAAVDPKKSSAKFTLVSVEKRGGAEFGKISGVVELALGSMGPMKLETAIPMKMSVELDVCIDGSAPTGVMKLKVEMKGSSTAAVEGQKIQLDLDLGVTGEMSKSAVK
jgi:hypothetical protein